ncbi:MAG: hypothetical protein IKU37_10600 [Candidatus Gastranaerophilales bacterium]|nr:hypothetical protein [Candidatus Gastranaerophilales bacterium]
MLRNSNSNCFCGSANKSFRSNDYYANINTAVALGKMQVPVKHKQLASNYILIKKIFGSCSAAIPITNADRSILGRHGFMPLENSTISQVNRQIEQLKSWANSGDILLSAYANELFEIRIKELKYLRLTVTSGRRTEFQDGFLALEKYIEYIAR